jgi:hypothetical protein
VSNYPSIEEYTNALQAAKNTIRDTLLAGGTVQLNNWGVPLARNGTFALTYKITAGGRDYAFRCFQRDRPGMHERYTAISASLASNPLPYFVGFEYLTNGITILQRPYPAIRMEWADGEPLGAYIERNVKDSGRLRVLLQQLHGMAFALEGAGIAHGDVQTNNILVAPSGEIKLVDYDGMFVPSISKMGALESGHRNFQHPEREVKSPFDGSLDRFSFALLHCSISALIENPGLWSSIGGDPEALLLRATDFADPYSSKAFGTLTKMPASGPVFLRLQAICAAPYEQIPTFNDFLAGRNIPTEKRIAGTSSKPPKSSSGSSVPWYKEATGSTGSESSSIAGLGSYTPKGKILDARDSALCLKSDGEQVELIGEVTEVEAEMDAVGHRMFKISLRTNSGPSSEILIWPKGITALTNAGIMIDDDLVGKWISVSGKLSLRWGGRSEAHPGVIVERVKQFEVLNAPQARWRLTQAEVVPPTNRSLIDSLGVVGTNQGAAGISTSNASFSGASPVNVNYANSSVFRSKALWTLLGITILVVALVIVSVISSNKSDLGSASSVDESSLLDAPPSANMNFPFEGLSAEDFSGGCWYLAGSSEANGDFYDLVNCDDPRATFATANASDSLFDCADLALYFSDPTWICVTKYSASPKAPEVALVGSCWQENDGPTYVQVDCTSAQATFIATAVRAEGYMCSTASVLRDDGYSLCLGSYEPALNPASYETCWTSPDIPDITNEESCHSGFAWTYDRCWSGAKGAELQQLVDGVWKTVREDIAEKSICGAKTPWNVVFTRQVEGPGTWEYRINMPDTSEGYAASKSYITAKTAKL